MTFESFKGVENNKKTPKLSEDVLEGARNLLKPTDPIKEFIGDLKSSPEIRSEVLASSLFIGDRRIEPPLSDIEEQLINLQQKNDFLNDSQKLEQLKSHLC